MKITDIKEIENVYHVTFTPNCIEHIFGVKGKVVRYKKTGYEYTFGGGDVYAKSDGSEIRKDSYVRRELEKFTRRF